IYLRFCCIPVDSVEVKSSFQATKTERDSADSPKNLVSNPGHRYEACAVCLAELVFVEHIFATPFATFPPPVIAAPIDFLQSPPSIMPAVSSALADIISQSEAGPGPSTMMNQQITSAATNPQSLPTPTSIIHPSSPLSDFLNIDGDAHMHEDDDHRDDFLRDFENL
ncbi:hypothetical protein H0H92_011728, partial [Tricholoma furcatifolium]